MSFQNTSIVVALCLLWSLGVSAQDGPSYTAGRLTAKPDLDGLVDDEAWEGVSKSQGAFFDLAAFVAERFAHENSRRRVAIGDRFDIHGRSIAHKYFNGSIRCKGSCCIN